MYLPLAVRSRISAYASVGVRRSECVFVYAYAPMYPVVFSCALGCVPGRVLVCAGVCVSGRVYLCIWQCAPHAGACRSAPVKRACVSVHVFLCMCARVRVRAYTCAHVFLCACTSVPIWGVTDSAFAREGE